MFVTLENDDTRKKYEKDDKMAIDNNERNE